MPPADGVAEVASQHSFVTGDTSQPTAPVQVEWRTATASIRDEMFWRAPTTSMTRLEAASGSAFLKSSHREARMAVEISRG